MSMIDPVFVRSSQVRAADNFEEAANKLYQIATKLREGNQEDFELFYLYLEAKREIVKAEFIISSIQDGFCGERRNDA